MISNARIFAVMALTVLATACGGSAGSENPNPADDSADTSDDELNTKARFTRLKSGPTDTNLAFLNTAGAKFEQSFRGVYRFNKATTEATSPDARMKRVKEVMHRYMCSFFDESIDIGRSTGAKQVATTMSDVNLSDNASDQTADVAKFSTALSFVFKNPKLDVMSGGATGNNTGGEVMGVYDIAHNEILFFGFTNCGSDD